eukprot:167150_1
MDKLYEDSYKHGFAVDLNDSMFDKYYKIVTKFDHISVNCNRNVVNNEKEQNNQSILDMGKKKRHECTLNNPFDIRQCVFIDYIIYCLNLFEGLECNVNMH